jgi:hypothetical protein
MSQETSRPKPHPIVWILPFIGKTEEQLAVATSCQMSYITRANRGLAEITPGYARVSALYLQVFPKALFRWNEELERELGHLQKVMERDWEEARAPQEPGPIPPRVPIDLDDCKCDGCGLRRLKGWRP